MKFFGIYRITNLLNGKMYIGKHITTNLDDGYIGSGKVIKQAIRKYGINNFRKEWLMFCEDAEELNYMERVYVNEDWISRSDTYNLVLGGPNPIMKGKDNPNFGKHLSEDIRKKISLSENGKIIPAHIRIRMAKAHQTDEFRHKCSESHKGKIPWNKGKTGIYSEETIKKISVSMSLKTKGEKNPMYGKANPNKGKIWVNNGKECFRVFKDNIPEGFIRGRLLCGKD